MITLFELKNKSFCRCFIRTPFYIKNLFLLGILWLILAFVYLVYFRRDGMVIENISKILKGLNSNTFNYLEVHSEPLRLSKLLNNYQTQITSNQFIDDCVRINKPCKFEGLAKTWPAFEKWRFSNNPYTHLASLLSDQQVQVHMDLDPSPNLGTLPGNSFKHSTLTKMKYSDFLRKMSEVQVGVTLRDEEEAVYKKLLPEITIPQFWSEINDLSGVTLIQGQAFYSPPRYERYE